MSTTPEDIIDQHLRELYRGFVWPSSPSIVAALEAAGYTTQKESPMFENPCRACGYIPLNDDDELLRIPPSYSTFVSVGTGCQPFNAQAEIVALRQAHAELAAMVTARLDRLESQDRANRFGYNGGL